VRAVASLGLGGLAGLAAGAVAVWLYDHPNPDVDLLILGVFAAVGAAVAAARRSARK